MRRPDAAWAADGRKGEGRVNRVPALAKTAPRGRAIGVAFRLHVQSPEPSANRASRRSNSRRSIYAYYVNSWTTSTRPVAGSASTAATFQIERPPQPGGVSSWSFRYRSAVSTEWPHRLSCPSRQRWLRRLSTRSELYSLVVSTSTAGMPSRACGTLPCSVGCYNTTGPDQLRTVVAAIMTAHVRRVPADVTDRALSLV